MAIASALSQNPIKSKSKENIFKAYTHKDKEKEREHNNTLKTKKLVDKCKCI